MPFFWGQVVNIPRHPKRSDGKAGHCGARLPMDLGPMQERSAMQCFLATWHGIPLWSEKIHQYTVSATCGLDSERKTVLVSLMCLFRWHCWAISRLRGWSPISFQEPLDQRGGALRFIQWSSGTAAASGGLRSGKRWHSGESCNYCRAHKWSTGWFDIARRCIDEICVG